MRLRALAKINLGLDVVGKRDDGYHEVRMIMQTIQMYDVLEIEKKKEPGIVLTTNIPYVPTDERNLVYKAAKMLMDEFDIKEGLTMNLEKFIPVAAGMAGGSSDAAAAFVGVNRLFGLGLSEEELMKRAVKVGADVPYCVMRGTALAEGIGEKLTRLPRVPHCYVLVGKPGVNVSTKTAYENLKLDDPAVVHPDIDGMVTAVRNGDLDGMISRMGNVFEPGIISKYPVIKDMVARLTKELLFDVKMEMPDVTLFDETDLVRTSKDIFSQKREKFIFIIDEWDSIFRVHRDNATAPKEYLDFLRDLLKGQPYVALAYMTGILPIKKYGQHSALNMFKE